MNERLEIFAFGVMGGPYCAGNAGKIANWLDEHMDEHRNLRVRTAGEKDDVPAEDWLKEHKDKTTGRFVSKFYRMDPNTEDLLPSGKYLANGMRVLIADSKQRIDVSRDMVDWEEDRALTNNRWCTVGALEVGGDITRFVAVYDDGSKTMRQIGTSNAWLVKIDSIRDSVNFHTDRFQSVLGIVQEAMLSVLGIFGQGTPDEKAADIANSAETATKKILGIL